MTMRYTRPRFWLAVGSGAYLLQTGGCVLDDAFFVDLFIVVFDLLISDALII